MFTDLDEASLRAACTGLPLQVSCVARTGSTNDDLLGTPMDGVPGGARLRCAGHQSAGRGRRGRHWIDAPGATACFSLALERFAPRGTGSMSGLSLACGVALAEALVDICPTLRVKWPNDLLRDERKVGGILIEVRREGGVERVVIGVGLNLLAPRAADARPLAAGAFAPGGLFDATVPDPLAPARIVAGCARSLLSAWERFERDGFAAFAARWDRFDALRGRPVGMRDAGREIGHGLCLGVATDGALRLSTPTGERRFANGEASPWPEA